MLRHPCRCLFIALAALSLAVSCSAEAPRAVATGGTSVGGGVGQSAGGRNAGGPPADGASSALGGGTQGGGPSAGGTAGGTSGGGAVGGTGSGGARGGSAPDLDQNMKANASPGDSTDISQDYLRLGEIRILNNNWGSEDLGCTAPTSTMSVFVDESGAFGWDFSRGDCAPELDTSHPDFPQVEFGIHPFGIDSDLETSPGFSSTTLLPLQIKDITSASITLDNLNIALQAQSSWNLAMEFWLSERHPVTDTHPGVHSEIMAWWGWQGGRWPCDLDNDGNVDYGDSVQAGKLRYTLCHQADDWAGGKWRYYQFRAGDGSDANRSRSFDGRIDVKAFLDYLVDTRGHSTELWVTRLEVGSEIDDDTSGTVTMDGITFEVNGETRSQVTASP